MSCIERDGKRSNDDGDDEELMTYRDIITPAEYKKLFSKGVAYRRKIFVRAVQISKPFLIEDRNGHVESGESGDYILQNLEGDSRPWIVSKNIFEANFEKMNGNEKKKSPSQSMLHRRRSSLLLKKTE